MTVQTAYIAPSGFEQELAAELGSRGVRVLEARGRLFLCSGSPEDVHWAQNVWLAPTFIPFGSISQGAAALKSIQRNWHCHATVFHRRCALIREHLPPVRFRPLPFGNLPPASPLGAWTLWDEHTILASARCSSPFPDGEATFVEDRISPPNRAYLKLWEAFTLTGVFPGDADLAVDLGASPGGWTWVMAKQGCKVFAIDKAPLDKAISALPQVDTCVGSGFAAMPQVLGPVDWLLSDMACYPPRLYGFVKQWIDSGLAGSLVCTIKLQGETDFRMLSRFEERKGSRLLHLSANKHELTFLWGKIVKKSLPRCF